MKSKREKKKQPIAEPEVLETAGWSVPVLQSAEQISVGSGGIAVASRKETKKLTERLQTAEPVAIFCKSKCTPSAEKIQVPFTNASGRTTLRDGFLHQLSTEASVTFSSDAPSLTVPSDTARIIVSCMSWTTEKTIFAAVSSNLKAALRR